MSFRKSWNAALAAALFCSVALRADTACNCDPSEPESMKQRQCSLCNEAEKQPSGTEVFFLKDANPSKPNRMLALPRIHTSGHHPLAELPPAARIALWTAAIDKAKQLWGDDWAVAYNGDRVRTQCHAHVHVGKLLPGVEAGDFVVISSPAEINPKPGEGVWIHPVAGKMHMHTGEQITETVLLR